MNYEDDLINEAIEEFTTGSTPVIKIAGASVVKAEAKHRRRVRTTMLSVLAALVIVTPVAAFAAMERGNHGPPLTPATSAATTAAPTPDASPSPTGAARPDGRLTKAQLTAAPLNIPAFEKNAQFCNGGSTRMHATESGDLKQGDVFIDEIVHANLDSDPALETAAELLCVNGDPPMLQVVAFDRDASGKIVVLGSILGVDDDVKLVKDIKASASGGIEVLACINCGSDPETHKWLDRHYKWDGSVFAPRYTQVPPTQKTAGFEIGTVEVRWSPAQNGKKTVTFFVRVRNIGTTAAADPKVELRGPSGERLALLSVAWGPIVGGRTFTLVFQAEVASSLSSSTGTFGITVDAAGAVHQQGNNTAGIPITKS